MLLHLAKVPFKVTSILFKSHWARCEMKLQPCVTTPGSRRTYGLTPTVIAYSLAQKVLIELKTEIFLLLPLASTLVLQLHVDNEILILTKYFFP